MFEGWSEFYLLAGSAAAVLIGLIFVVISLLQDRPRSTVLVGSRLYMGPIVLAVSFVLVISAAALTPGIDRRTFAVILALIALWGLVRGAISTAGIWRLGSSDDPPHWTDVWFYGVAPCALYLLLAGVALAFWDDAPCARQGVAGVIMASLLLAIRNEWDLITWITPRGTKGGRHPGLEPGSACFSGSRSKPKSSARSRQVGLSL